MDRATNHPTRSGLAFSVNEQQSPLGGINMVGFFVCCAVVWLVATYLVWDGTKRIKRANKLRRDAEADAAWWKDRSSRVELDKFKLESGSCKLSESLARAFQKIKEQEERIKEHEALEAEFVAEIVALQDELEQSGKRSDSANQALYEKTAEVSRLEEELHRVCVELVDERKQSAAFGSRVTKANKIGHELCERFRQLIEA